jgi:hypothetical protein
MAKALDPIIREELKKHGFGPDACWDCHGTWVVYHRVLEQIATKAEIKFELPQIIESDGPNKSVALCVSGAMNGASQWSIGEAAPGNNKNAYPYAMAEKRAKDRVILKLIGLHGLLYSEDEATDFSSSNGGTPAAGGIDGKQKAKIVALKKTTEANGKALLEFFKVGSLDELTGDQAIDAIAMLEEKLEKKQGGGAAK